MAKTPLVVFNFFLLIIFTLVHAQSSDVDTTATSSSLQTGATSTGATATISGTVSSYRARFTVPTTADLGATVIPNVKDPQAADAQTVCPGYTASNVVNTTNGLTASLTLAGPACNIYGSDIADLSLMVEYQSQNRLHIQIQPTYISASNSSQFILSENLVRKPTADGNTTTADDISFTWSNNPSFGFTVTRKSTSDTLFSTQGKKLVFENQFIEFASPLPENYNLYGLGETIDGLRLGNNRTKTMYAADVADPIDYNIYGSHPFYLDTRYYEVDSSSGNQTLVTSNQTSVSANYTSYSHGTFLRNAHPQEILLRAENITWRTLGGSIDLYFFAGPSVVEVTKSFQKDAVGLPAMQQYFTFGFHQCRWGYANWTELQQVVNNFEQFGIPLENIWTDIDYMNQYRDFSNDQNTFSFSEGRQFLDALHAGGRHYIPIVDAAIYIPNPDNASDAYPTFDRGNAANVFMHNADGSLYIGSVWPGYTVFPDWLSSGSSSWWSNEMITYHSDISFDGIWIDMSEVSSFCVGSCGSANISMNPVHPPFSLPGEPGAVIYDYPEGFNVTNATEAASASAASSSQAASSSSANAAGASSTMVNYLRTTPTPGVRDINHPPYVINNVQGDLAANAMSPNATHADGTLDYDVHNIYGHQLLNATYNALLNVFPGKRPFIIGRSTFSGSGVWAGHWGGDNYSRFAYMFFSIPQALTFSLLGIPMFGVDTCGFNFNTDEELCNRWMQLSAFFPFYRNHNTLTARSQEPYLWASVADASRRAMAIRYLLLPYMYTLFYNAHTDGDTVMRALAWEFPNDPSLAAADRQFLLGPALLVTPVLTPGATSVDGVFPGSAQGEVWYDWYNQSAISIGKRGENVTIDAPLGHIPLYLRGGYILPTQEPGMTTRESRQGSWGVIAALNQTAQAEGSLYIDDGESIVQNKKLDIEFVVLGNRLTASVEGSFEDGNSLANVTVLGVRDMVNRVVFNEMVVPSSGVVYNESTMVLKITGLQNFTHTGAWGTNWTLGWS
ncbi:MAG: hypothetical protein M1812_006373 [Candelaria pacifica]|nr:MAG: hypothetical protein M1812_006373 [Candelaria pacifica]